MMLNIAWGKMMLKKIKQKFYSLGDVNILKLYKIGFFCSRKVPANIILKAFDWAVEQREKGNCIISGFHSQIEKDVFHYLLKGNQPIILVHGRGLLEREDPDLMRYVTAGRLLILTPFNKSVKRVTSDTAMKRNKFMIALADEIFVAYAMKGGNIDNLLKGLKNKKVATF